MQRCKKWGMIVLRQNQSREDSSPSAALQPADVLDRITPSPYFQLEIQAAILVLSERSVCEPLRSVLISYRIIEPPRNGNRLAGHEATTSDSAGGDFTHMRGPPVRLPHPNHDWHFAVAR